MKATVKWLDHMSFVGESGSGHSIVMDGAPDVGGRNMGVRPMEMVLLGSGRLYRVRYGFDTSASTPVDQ